MVTTNTKRWIAGLICASAMLANPAVMAEIVTFNVTWAPTDMSGHFVEGTAAASATLVMDTIYVPNGPGSGRGLISMDKLISLSVTVTGTGAGDGTFGKSDFSGMDFHYGRALNFSGQLIGQYPPGDLFDHLGRFGGEVGGGGNSGAFNFFANRPGVLGGPAAAPSGVYPFMMISNGNPNLEGPGAGIEHALLGVNSIIATPAAAIPEPSTYAMFLGGLGLVGLMARRKRSHVTALSSAT